MKRTIVAGLAAMAGACVAPSEPPEDVAVVQPIPAPSPTPTPAPTPAGPTTFLYSGELEQGGWIRGQAPAGAVSARLGETATVRTTQAGI